MNPRTDTEENTFSLLYQHIVSINHQLVIFITLFYFFQTCFLSPIFVTIQFHRKDLLCNNVCSLI